ncbi:MAG: hypothetical protein M0P63_01900 [Azoarcus sp.]|nr:hypothetical protein [Azoarcus sp.]
MLARIVVQRNGRCDGNQQARHKNADGGVGPDSPLELDAVGQVHGGG